MDLVRNDSLAGAVGTAGGIGEGDLAPGKAIGEMPYLRLLVLILFDARRGRQVFYNRLPRYMFTHGNMS
jgi:hypothetical protein